MRGVHSFGGLGVNPLLGLMDVSLNHFTIRVYRRGTLPLNLNTVRETERATLTPEWSHILLALLNISISS